MLNVFLTAILLVVGVVLLVLELFLLPGFGMAGIGGCMSLCAAIALAYIKISPMAGHIVLAVSALLAIVSIVIFFRSRALQKIGLDKELNDTVEMPKAGKHMDQLKNN